MNSIKTINDQHFSLNGIQYFKNYISTVHGDKIEVYNCYERKDILIPLTHFANFLVNDVAYSSVNEVQAALLNITYARLTIGNGSAINQNNVCRVINIGLIGPPPPNDPFYTVTKTIIDKLNAMQISITEVHAPVIITATIMAKGGTHNFISKKHKYLFKQGKGNWGANGTKIVSSYLELIHLENYLLDELLSEPNAIIENLGEVPDGNFIIAANKKVWDFTQSGFDGDTGIKTYYFSYETSGVLYFAQFVGIPDLYGGIYDAKFKISDFIASTNSQVTNIPTLANVLAQGGNTNISQLTNNGNGLSPYATVSDVTKHITEAKFKDFVIIKNINYTINPLHDIGQTGVVTVYINAVNNNITITLPSSLQASDGYTYNFKRIDNSSYTAKIASSMTIEGQPNITLIHAQAVTIKSVYDKYWIMSKYIP